MNCNVTIDWKFVAALGVAVGAIIFASKMDDASAEKVSIHMIDACKDYANALKGVC